MSDSNVCIEGQWQKGVCVCEQGYTSRLPGASLHPIYCDIKEEVLVSEMINTYKRSSILHYSTMALTVGIAMCSFIALLFLLYIIWKIRTLKGSITAAENLLLTCQINQKERNTIPLLYSELWTLPTEFTCINEVQAKIKKETKEQTVKEKQKMYAKVIHPYKPEDKNELHLRYPGDIIINVVQLEQGWCKGKLNGKEGFFPLAFTELYSSSDDVTSDKSKAGLVVHAGQEEHGEDL